MKARTISLRICCILFLFGLGLFPVEAKEKQPKKPLPEFPFKRFYIDASVGHGFVISSLRLAGDWEPITVIFSNPGTSPNGLCSFTRGIHVGLNFGYRFNKYLALDIGGKYMAYINTDRGAFNWMINYISDTISNEKIIVREVADFYDNRAVSGHIGQVSFMLVAAPGFARVDPYIKAGMIFTVGHIFADQNLVVNDCRKQNEEGPKRIYEQRYKHNQWTFKAGFIGAIGMNIHITPVISTFFECQFSVSGLFDLDWRDLKLVSESGDQELADQLFGPRKRHTGIDKISFNNYGFHIGVKFKF